ncbi:prophage endopeptidase [Pseudomonas guineae]|uniref:Prophage endopeptidase n=1 Tax=Pseudomonas guineae TaxID=425504 RepID=A0A1I3K9R1_9PSED|nr:lysis system i-spanin subunit Rz [Pseudomonas guineae]SFI69207.1 prophage endopeptidase [Pseudomonas guineae]
MRVLIAITAALSVLLVLALWRIDNVTSERDNAVTAADESAVKAESLRVTLRISRELITDYQAAEAEYQKETTDAQDEADRLRRCLADGTCGLRVNATCVRVDRPTAIAGEPDAGTAELTAAAGWDYSALQQGLKQHRAQIKGLQKALIGLHSKCKIIGVGSNG